MHPRKIILVMTSLLTWGCAATFYDKSIQTWDAWVGTSKDDRVKELGVPTRCHAFKSGGEACEWPVRWTADSLGTITVQFDSKENVCQWHYRDAFQDRTSHSQCS